MYTYKVRCRVPGGGWTNWKNWSTTTAAEQMAESKRLR